MARQQLKNSAESIKIDDAFFMACALAEAKLALQNEEVPIGAVVVIENQIVGRGHNQPIGSCDATAHAEIMALRQAAQTIGNYRLTEADLYVTIEPCVMCAGALVNARIRRLVFGATEERFGAVVSQFQLCNHSSLNHQIEVTHGVFAAECRALMQNFFQQRRGRFKPE